MSIKDIRNPWARRVLLVVSAPPILLILAAIDLLILAGRVFVAVCEELCDDFAAARVDDWRAMTDAWRGSRR